MKNSFFEHIPTSKQQAIENFQCLFLRYSTAGRVQNHIFECTSVAELGHQIMISLAFNNFDSFQEIATLYLHQSYFLHFEQIWSDFIVYCLQVDSLYRDYLVVLHIVPFVNSSSWSFAKNGFHIYCVVSQIFDVLCFCHGKY